MFGLTILDLILILALLSYLIYGLRNGFLVTLGGIAGFVAGAIAATFAIPVVSGWVTDERWRLTAIVATGLLLVVVGHSLGTLIGRSIRGVVRINPLKTVDRLLGGAANLAVSALVMSLLAFSVSSLGVPVVSAQIAESRVIRFIDGATPTQVKATMAQLRSAMIGEGIPTLIEGLGQGQGATVAAPEADTTTPDLTQAASSVLKITGTAFQCGQNQTGSGFVVADGKVVTNAHVVAGVPQPVVQISGAGAYQATVVYFDAVHDLAVLSVDGLPSAPLELSPNLPSGSAAVFAGYPHGGPFTAQPATVQDISTVLVPDIYGENPAAEDIYRLSGNVQPGNSGGPLLTTSGQVAGVIFAKTTTDAAVGFAITMDELAPVAAQSSSLTAPVSPGSCIQK